MSNSPARKNARLTAADWWILTCAAGVLIGFTVMPWLGNANGIGLLSGAATAPANITLAAPLILIPIIGGLALALALLGLFAPRYKRLAGWLMLPVALLGLAYYALWARDNFGYLVGAIRLTGIGFWAAFAGLIGLIVQVFAPRGRRPVAAEKERSLVGQTASAVSSAALAPVRMALRPFAVGCVALAFGFGACMACAIFIPSSFQAILDLVRSAAVRTYTFVSEVTGRPVLKVIVYEAEVTAVTVVRREMGALGFLWGEGAEIRGQVRVSLGADLTTEQFGVINCDIKAETLQEYIGRAPLAGTAFDANDIRQEAYAAFKAEAARQAITQFWPKAQADLANRFEVWAVGLEVPLEPTLRDCPVEPPAG